VRSVLRNDGEAEDVMQEAYVNAFAHLAEFEGRAKFSTWLTRIAIHEAFARLRRNKRFTSLDDSEPIPMRDSKTPERDAAQHELGRVLEHAVDDLPDAFRTVFVLRAVEEMSVAETAEALEIPEDTVKTRLHRARALLRRSILERTEATLPTLLDFHLSRCDRVTHGVLRRIGVST
jgi:RNA polymerase sigma-70 factor (ECF subfamily)